MLFQSNQGGVIMSSSLRDQFIDQMTFEGFSECTKKSYVTAVKGLAKFYNLSPDLLTSDQVYFYFRHLITERKMNWSTCNNYLSGVIYFYKNICQWEDVGRFGLPPRPYQKKLPVTLSIEEIQRLFAAVTNLKHRVLLKTTYSAGLRVSEVISLMPHHIESDPSRMLIRVEQGKGRKDRYTLLSEELLEELRLYWKKYHPQKWLFPGYGQDKHLSYAAARKVFMAAKKKANITKPCCIHCLRHSFATHLLYQGADLYTISHLLGHKSIDTTTIYLHITPERFVKLKSPLDRLELEQGGDK